MELALLYRDAKSGREKEKMKNKTLRYRGEKRRLEVIHQVCAETVETLTFNE